MEFVSILDKSGMKMTEFSEYFGIPYRTVQDWKAERRKCPDYLLDLMEYKLIKENIITIKEEKGMRKYLVVDEPKNGGDIYTTVCDTLEDANKEAEYQWDHLTCTEKKDRHIYVGHVEDNEKYLNDWAFDDDEVDYEAYHSLGVEQGYFDSDK